MTESFDTEFALGQIEIPDIPAVIDIADECGLSPWSRQNLVDELSLPDSIMLLIKKGDMQPVGFIVGRVIKGNLDGSTTEGEIYNIAVVVEFRGRGLGSKLLDSFRERCKTAGVGVVWLEVRASNLSAIAFYESNGFVKHSVRTGFYSNPTDDAFIMSLSTLNPITDDE